MRRSVWVVLGLLFLGMSGISTTTMAAALTDPFSRDGVNYDPQEWELIKESLRKAVESNKVGTEETWEYAKTGRAGVVKVTRVFQSKGMDCVEVEHMITKGTGGRYILPFCKAPDGSWKVAF